MDQILSTRRKQFMEINRVKMSVITPSYKQLDWLRLCVASVRDQVPGESTIHNPQSAISPLSVEHIVQDAGTPGIEEFAREIGADFYRDGELVFASAEDQRSKIEDQIPPSPISHLQSPVSDLPSSISSYQIAIYCEKDSGMYDAVNRGFRRATGDVFSYLNCDEQYLPGALEKVAAYFQKHPENDVALGDTLVVHADGSYMCHRKGLSPQTAHTWVSGNLSFATAASFARAKIFHEREIYFDTKWKAIGDADWGLRLCQAGMDMAALGFVTSVFTDTGANLDTLPNSRQEKVLMRKSAPRWMQAARQAIIAHYRFRKLLAGSYFLAKSSYQIYTQSSPDKRVDFVVANPSHKWQGR